VKALLVRLSSIGDVVHTLPALAALHRHGWDAGWVVEPNSRILLDNNPLVTQVIGVPAARSFDWRAALNALRAARSGRYDAALDFQGLWKSAAWARLSGARRIVGYARPSRREPSSALLLRERVAWPEGPSHVIDKNLALLRPLGVEAVGLRDFPLPFSAEAVARADRAVEDAGRGGISILNPGGGWSGKLWPAERFGELASGLRARGLLPLVTWGPGEEALADQVVGASAGAAVRSRPTTLLDFAELARRARLVVAADTGPLHLACAVGAPVVGLFGPTDPTRNGPFAAGDVVVRRVPPCAPCYRRGCLRHAGVMQEIPVAEVLAAAEGRLATAGEHDWRAV
jgi:lipopolysaccharide heptosyltransferase I